MVKLRSVQDTVIRWNWTYPLWGVWASAEL